MEVALADGGVFLSSFLQAALQSIALSRRFNDFFHGKDAIKLNEETLDKLESTLNSIFVVLEDAENKQAKSPAVRKWIDKLKEVVHHADDMLDEINTECLRFKVYYEFRSQETKADRCVSFKKLYSKSSSITKLMPDLRKITDRLDEFVKQIHVLGLQKFDPKETCAYRVSSSSVVDESRIFGRDEEKEKLTQMVLSDGGASDVSVIPITGMGGIGKTTLAQLVYNDEKVKDHFPVRAWVCVSEEYTELRVAKALLMEVNSCVVDDKDDFNRVQVKLRDSLAGKCFLIILDDIWNENYNDWHNLKNPLIHGRKGSKILVTTRSEKVALMMQNEPFHHMHPIQEDQSWSLFKPHAFDSGAHTPPDEFETIGKEIVKKCKGLPLAIKTIAGALRPKRDINDWHDILNSELWTTAVDILPSLSLSYKHLPSHLKSCFAICSLFPKDFPFEKDEVVLLWMANDLVQPSTHKSWKETGRDYFEELRSRSLFEMVNEDMYLMHDLVNDFTQYVSGNFCVRLQDYQDTSIRQGVQREIDLPREVLHFSYLGTHEDTSKKFRALAEVHGLRTFLPIHRHCARLTTLFFSDILPRFRRIRVLNLSKSRIKVIPDSIGDLKHLRYINLANTPIRVLPNAITKCLNLQTLILAHCWKLEEFPKDIRLLINLQHIDIRGPAVTYDKMISLLNMLTDIENISIVADWIPGSILEKLCKLQLSNFLIITGLENGVTVEIAKKVELKKKHCIEDLIFVWNGIAECHEDDFKIFSELQPHTNTKRLKIAGYGERSFSDWLGDAAFSNMELLVLQNCKNCSFLPPLGQLTRLKQLEISGMDGIIEVGDEFYGNDFISKPFQALEELKFNKMSQWAIWNTVPDNVDFPSLRLFSIADCPKLVGDFPFDVTSLKEFQLQRCPGVSSNPNELDVLTIEDCPTLSLSLQSFVVKHLKIVKNCNLVEFPTSYNSCLESLCIDSCDNSIEEIPLFFFSNLRGVDFLNWENPKLFKFPNGYDRTITGLQRLKIYNCNNILSFPDGGLSAPNLKEFILCKCEKLKSLPEQVHTLLPLLQSVAIGSCPKIECFPEGGLPSSLKSLSIYDCEKKLMICRSNWDLQRLSSLTDITINGVEDKLFPEEGLLPSSLQKIDIGYCYNLKSLNQKGFQHLTSLQSLSIKNCKKLKYLPERKLLSTLSWLSIDKCPKLKVSKQRGKGKEWNKVSHITLIYIDDELI